MLLRRLAFSTATVCTVALTVPAQADMQVYLGGYTGVQAAVFENDAATNSSRDFLSEAEIFVRAENTADNGLQYGAKLELHSSTSDSVNADEASLWLGGAWGKLELGDNDGATELLKMTPVPMLGYAAGSYDDYIPAADRGHPLVNRGAPTHTLLDTDDATKLTYTTPLYAGWQFGVSYAPFSGNLGENVQTTTGSLPEDVFEAGLSYSGSEGDFGYYLSSAFTFGNGASATEDLSVWGLGAQLTYQGFVLGGGYTQNSDSLNPTGTSDDNVRSWNLGLAYNWDKYSVGASYLNLNYGTNGDSSSQLGTDGNGGRYSSFVLGGSYKIAPGLSTSSALAFYDRNRASGTDTSGWVMVQDLTAAF